MSREKRGTDNPHDLIFWRIGGMSSQLERRKASAVADVVASSRGSKRGTRGGTLGRFRVNDWKYRLPTWSHTTHTCGAAPFPSLPCTPPCLARAHEATTRCLRSLPPDACGLRSPVSGPVHVLLPIDPHMPVFKTVDPEGTVNRGAY